MNRRYKLFKAVISSRCPKLWSDYKRARNEVTSELRKLTSAYFSNIFSEVKTSSAHWNFLKGAINPKVHKNIGPLKRDDDTLEFTDVGKADLIKSYFAMIGLKLSNSLSEPPTNLDTVRPTWARTIARLRLSEAYISKPMVADKIKALRTKKSTGPDNMPPKLLKLAADATAPSLFSLYRLNTRTRSAFTSWKMARLTPVFKRDDETYRGNYRPISLFSVPNKILESVVNDTLVRHVHRDNNLVSDKQWAYRSGYSTELLLIYLTELWRKAVDSDLTVAVEKRHSTASLMIFSL